MIKKSQYNKFVEGTCDFTENTAKSSNEDNDSKRTVFSKPVDLAVEQISWKIKMDSMRYVNSDYPERHAKFFGIVEENSSERGKGYHFKNYYFHRA